MLVIALLGSIQYCL